ncbi:unnamed protein product [Phytomonas sp. EM1]|nr:unnamed protein product [Phytomonas sp. EM1]|eukprot:CCW65245.1 unnamed protein product [Phytomonas sp. isolate EM1]
MINRESNLGKGSDDGKIMAAAASGISSLQTSDFLDLLRSFPSSLEVKCMIDDALHRFEKKSLPRLLGKQSSQAAAQVNTGTSSAVRSNNLNSQLWLGDGFSGSGTDTRLSSKDVEWLVMVMRAQVEAELLLQLSQFIKEEVAIQLKAFFPKASAVQTHSSPERPPLPCSPCVKTRQASCTSLKMQMNLATSLMSDEDYRGDEIDSVRLQRERTSNTLLDVDYQLNCLQRQVNELAHQFRTAQQRLEQLCLAFDSTRLPDSSFTSGNTGESPMKVLATMPPSGTEDKIPNSHGVFYIELLAALDACDLSEVRRLVRTRCKLLETHPSLSTGRTPQETRSFVAASSVENVLKEGESIHDPVAAAARHLAKILDENSETSAHRPFKDVPDKSPLLSGSCTSDWISRMSSKNLQTQTHRRHDRRGRDTHLRYTSAVRSHSITSASPYSCSSRDM